MYKICCICRELKEVQEIVSAKSFMVLLTGNEDSQLLVCKECTPTVTATIKQALTMMAKII